MRQLTPLAAAEQAPITRGVVGAFQVSLWMALMLMPTVFGCLHRYATFDLLLVVCLLLAFWILSSLQGEPLWHVRSWANVALWGLLALALLQISPVPRIGSVGLDLASLGRANAMLIDGPVGGLRFLGNAALPVGRYSLRPTAAVGLFVLLASAACLYWLVGAALIGRQKVRRATWAVILGLAALALWVMASGLASAGHLASSVVRQGGAVMILGGDSLVPALLAALPLSIAVVLRLVGWMPRRRYRRRQTGLGWLARAAPVWAAMALALAGLVALALGMSNVPRVLLVICVALAVGFVLGGYLLWGPAHRGRRRPVGLVLVILLWIVFAMWLGTRLGPAFVPAASGDDSIEMLMSAAPRDREIAGVGAGAISPRILFGAPGWPAAGGEDRDTNGYLVLWAEVGWLGLFGVFVLAVATGFFLIRAWRRTESPWPKTIMWVGLGALVSNILYFRYDAVALLAPNLLALAAVFGVVMAWSAHGAMWRPARFKDLGQAHWPLVIGAMGLIGALGLAENEMLTTAAGPRISDKILHFGTFAVVTILLCYALGPRPTVRYLKTHISTAVLGAMAIGVLVEYAQRYLTVTRGFEIGDMIADGAGAVSVAVLWWVVRRSQVSEAAGPRGVGPPDLAPEPP